MNRFQVSLELWRQSLRVLRQDAELLLFPALSLAATVLLVGGTILLFPGGWSGVMQMFSQPEYQRGFWHYAILFVWYLVSFSAMYFLNAGLIGCVIMRLEGKDPTIQDGFRIAWENRGRIVGWALVSTTVILLLQLLERIKIVRRLLPVFWFLELSWALLTYLVVPVLIVERVGPLEAIKRSGNLFKQTWGERAVAQLGLGLVTSLLILAGAVPIALGALLGSPITLYGGIGVAVLYVLGLITLSSALGEIYRTALYHYATTGKILPGFAHENVADAFQGK